MIENLVDNYSSRSDDLIESILLQIRSEFATWAAQKQMFETLCLMAEVKIIVSATLKSLAEVSNEKGIQLYMHQCLIDHYSDHKETVFFVILHELRHCVQVKSLRDWKHLVSFSPLIEALNSVLPKALLKRAGIIDFDSDFNGDFECDFDLKHEIFNLAADAAIHEDLVKIFGRDILNKASEVLLIRARFENPQLVEDKSISIGPITVEALERITATELKRDQDWLYYAKQLVHSLSTRVQREPELARLLVDRQILRRIRDNGLSQNNIDLDALAEIDRCLGKAKGESKKMIESLRSQRCDGPGTEALDYEELHQARKDLTGAIRKIIEIIRSAVQVGHRRRWREQRTYARPHLFLNEAPGLKRKSIEAPHSESVIVLDSSGSMWVPELLEQMAGLVFQLKRRDLILKAYCCDTKLHILELGNSGSAKFKGSGGSIWTSDHHTQILRDLNTTKKITIYYCTDGVVDGLSQAVLDDRVSLVVINLPRIITEELYERAAI